MEDLRKYTKRTELYKLSAEEQTEKMKLVMTYFSMDMMCHLNWTGKR